MTSSPVRRAMTGNSGGPCLLEAYSVFLVAQLAYHNKLSAEVKGMAGTGVALFHQLFLPLSSCLPSTASEALA